jgi:hypothetical protein
MKFRILPRCYENYYKFHYKGGNFCKVMKFRILPRCYKNYYKLCYMLLQKRLPTLLLLLQFARIQKHG